MLHTCINSPRRSSHYFHGTNPDLSSPPRYITLVYLADPFTRLPHPRITHTLPSAFTSTSSGTSRPFISHGSVTPMSLLQGTLHSGDPATHNGSNSSDEVTRHPARLRESQSHANLLSPLTPLIRLIRDPATSLEGLLDRVWIGEEPSEDERKAEVDRRKQLLNGRMTDVRFHAATVEARHSHLCRQPAIPLGGLQQES